MPAVFPAMGTLILMSGILCCVFYSIKKNCGAQVHSAALFYQMLPNSLSCKLSL